MTSITLKEDSRGKLIGFTISGHAESGPYGQDLVCAAISILSYTTVNSLIKVAKIHLKDLNYKEDEEKGLVDILLDRNLPKEKKDKAHLLLESFQIGVLGLQESNPQEVEVDRKGVLVC